MPDKQLGTPWHPIRDLAMKTIVIDDHRTFPALVLCRSGEAGIEVMKHLDFDMLLLDMYLAGRFSGLDVLDWLKVEKLLGHSIPSMIIAVSAGGSEEITRRAAELVGVENVGWITSAGDYSGRDPIFYGGIKGALCLTKQ